MASTSTWRKKLEPLSPLSVLLAAGIVFVAVVLPRTGTTVIEIQADHGNPPALLASLAANLVLSVVLVGLAGFVVAKDWWLATERARVWANLGLWLVVGLFGALLQWGLTAPVHEIVLEQMSEFSEPTTR